MLGAGTRLDDRYVLADRLGGGGMGEVWRADDTVLGRVVALKVMMPALTENPTLAQRFLNEARAMATLRHPGVVDVYDHGTTEVGGRRLSYLVMEYVPGESLDRVLRRGPLGCAATMRLVGEVGDALAAAHARGIVHRDVKPANLMVRPDGQVVLTDFGIAHSVSAGHLTATGTMLCSAGYCAPEMAAESEVTPAVDVYALGVVAYECLTGQLPFQGDTPVQIIFKHLNSPIPSLPGDVPPGPRQVVERALAKTPGARWPSAAHMALAARAAMASPGTQPMPVPVPVPVPVPAPRRRRTTRAALTMAGAVLVSAAVAGFVWLRPATPTADTTVSPTVTSTSPTASPSATPTPTRPRSAPPTKLAPSPEPTRTTPAPSPSATPTPTPTTTPSPDPTTPDPEPSQEPSEGPGPTEPGPEEPTIGRPTEEIQCIRAPCP